MTGEQFTEAWTLTAVIKRIGLRRKGKKISPNKNFPKRMFSGKASHKHRECLSPKALQGHSTAIAEIRNIYAHQLGEGAYQFAFVWMDTSSKGSGTAGNPCGCGRCKLLEFNIGAVVFGVVIFVRLFGFGFEFFIFLRKRQKYV